METLWHTKNSKEVFEIINSSETGLTRDQAKSVLDEHGENKLPESKSDSLLIIFLRQFQNPLIYVLIAACVMVFAIGENIDGTIILIVLIFNAIVGAIQEGRAQNTLNALKQFVNTKAIVLRDGKETIIPDTQVVAGDVLILQEGEKIPADARIIQTNNLKIDEAALTGESEAVSKVTHIIDKKEAVLPEQKNMVFKGTNILSGEGKAVVVRTGINTAIGKIAQKISSIETEIPLKANLRNLSHVVIGITLVMSIFIFFVGTKSGLSNIEMFTTVISLAVSVIPEGLPIALTLILATGVWRMSKKNALVKRLQAVEALGQAQIIAVDKTGTLTKNEMVVQEVYVDGETYEISGVGYEANGTASINGKKINIPDNPNLLFAGKIATFCANARVMVNEDTKEYKIAGDPTEAALLILGEKLGFDKESLEKSSPTVNEITFTHENKFHVMMHDDKGEKIITVVGAPESVLKLSTKIWSEGSEKSFTEGELENINDKLTELSSKGLRVLAFAITKDVPSDFKVENLNNLTFVGFYGMKDALRPEVKDATRKAQSAGIRVIMITGDHKGTAEAIAREALIFKDGDKILTGEEIDKLSDKSLTEALDGTAVFARVTPDHKLRIVNSFKARGEVIAMTGDGVNDAPSLVAADLGVGMGKIGTEVAKEASDIVLLDDNFGSIVDAIEEGRNIYKTIRKVVLYLLSTSIGEMLVIVAALLLGWPIPIIAAQIIWLNFVTDGFFDVALAMEPKEEGLLKEKFKKPAKYLVDKVMGLRMALMALPMMVGTLLLFSNYYEADLVHGWTISLTILSAFQWLNAWNCRSENKSIFTTNPFNNKYLILATFAAVGAHMFAIYHPFFQKYLRTTSLSLYEWLIILSFSSSIIVVEEVRKLIVRLSVNTKRKIA